MFVCVFYVLLFCFVFFFFFFFLMIRRPPRSTLFPTRRSSDLGPHRPEARDHCRLRGRGARSEEHTSELQSHVNLVCRLLLEKKKNKNKKTKAHRGAKTKREQKHAFLHP